MRLVKRDYHTPEDSYQHKEKGEQTEQLTLRCINNPGNNIKHVKNSSFPQIIQKLVSMKQKQDAMKNQQKRFMLPKLKLIEVE